MILTKIAILAVKGFGPEQKERLATSLGVSIQTLYRYIQDNDDNLTKAAALKVIREETGLDDTDLLQEEIEEPAAKV